MDRTRQSVLLYLSTFFLYAFLIPALASADMTIVDVRRNIPLSDDEPVFTDYYIAASENEGLKKNQVVTVLRSLNIRDNSGAQSFGEISVPVAQVRILSVYGKIAVAREFKSLSREENPMLEQTGIMSGDKISTKDSFVDNSKTKRKPQAVAEAKTAEPVPAATAVVVPTSVPTKPAESPAPKEEVAKTADANTVPEELLTNPAEKPPTEDGFEHPEEATLN